jgi:pSer/pThr/pTyr-binding forkhead associated (FHA) protein
LHVINFNNAEKIKLGRGHDTDVRIHDISVSRLHAFIAKDPETGRLFIEDNGSKFGTLVQIQAPLILKENHEYNF